MIVDPRNTIRNALQTLWTTGDGADVIAENAVFSVAWPVNELVGRDAIVENFITPIRNALADVHRRDLIFIGGDNIREQGGYWCAAVTHYVGNFTKPLFGLLPSNSLVFLRAGEFYRIENGQITEAKIIFDLPDVMHQAGCLPLPSLGTEITFPVPVTQDGLCPQTEGGEASLNVVQRMLGALHVFDPVTKTSASQTGEDGTWADDMMWYGPAGIGSNYRWEGFSKDHRVPFLDAFPDRKGGNHYCRIGDANYAAVSGWPSMTMTFQGDYLGQPADGRALTLRVMDFYRVADNRIKENWVTLDYGDLFAQMGRDLIAEANALRD